MSQIQTHSRTDNTRLGFEPRDTGMKPMCFKSNKCPDRQTDMVALRNFEPVQSTFHPSELLEATMVDLNLPGIQGMEGSLLNGHVQAAGGPVCSVAVCAARPKHLAPAISFEVNQTPLRWNEDLADRTVTTAIRANFPIALELCQPVPFQTAQQFEIGQPAIPTVKRNQFWLKAALVGLFDHVLKVVILAQAILDLVIKSIITRQPTFAICPDQRNQVDALHHGVVLARPMPTNQRHMRCIRFVQRRIVDDQYAFRQINQLLHFLPERPPVP